MTTKAIKDVQVGDIVGITYKTCGTQWTLVKSIEVGEKTTIKVKLPNHVGGAVVTLIYENDKNVNWQTRYDFDRWCELYDLTPFA